MFSTTKVVLVNVLAWLVQQSCLSILKGRDRFAPGVNVVHQLYDPDSLVAPRLWNLYQFLNKVIRDIIINRRRFSPGDAVWNSVYSVEDYLNISMQDEGMHTTSFHEIMSHALLRPELSNHLPFKDSSSIHQINAYA